MVCFRLVGLQWILGGKCYFDNTIHLDSFQHIDHRLLAGRGVGDAWKTLLGNVDGVLQGLLRQEFGGLQGIQALQNDGERKDGARNKRPYGPSCCLYDAGQSQSFYFWFQF